MAIKVFDRILIQGINAGQIPARTQQAREWFRSRARRSRTTTPGDIQKAEIDRVKGRPQIGKMYFYNYDPKFKNDDKVLPYYDIFPCTIIVDYTKDGWYGLNLHYLPLKERAILLDALYGVVSDTRYDRATAFRITYNMLNTMSQFKEFRPTLKRYIANRVGGKIIEVFSSEWDIAMFLPVEKFKKASARKVWADSRKKIR